LVEVVIPPHKHVTPLLQPLGGIVWGANAVSFNMGKLAFDPIRFEFMFIENGRRRAAQPMHCCLTVVAKVVQSIEERVL
jgi:hypothetical protein